MRNEIIRNFLPRVFVGGFIFAILTVGVLAQTENEKPRIKNFGSSLRKNPLEKDKRKKDRNEKNVAADADLIRVETNLVVSEVLVLDKKGRAIRRLKKEDFIVTEDKQPQEIETFSLGNDTALPRSIVLIIDYSGSQHPYIKTSVNAAKILVDKLAARDRMAIVTDDVDLLADFTADKKLLKEKLESLKKKALNKNFLSPGRFGRSEQTSALYAVLNEVFDERDVRPIIIFQADGDEIPLLKNSFWDGRVETKNFSFDDVLTATEKSRATIY